MAELTTTPEATATGKPIRLLLVEDDADQRDLIRETLEDHFGPGTVTAVASRAAAAVVDVAHVDMVLADYNLPDGSGLDLMDDVHKRAATPVIIVTGENVGKTAAEAVRRGATDYVVKIGDYLFTIPLVVEKNLTVAHVKRENELLRSQLERAMVELQLTNGQLSESLQRTEQMAATDPLTQLYNRRHFNRMLEQMFAESHRFDTDLACVMIDLDKYKQLNDAHGHQVGDQLLIAAGKAITANLRRMDVAARYGGDEFILLLPRAMTAEAIRVAGRIRDDYFVSSAGVLKTPGQGVRMSIGVGSARADRAATAEALVAAADAALYKAKAAGRDRISTAAGELTLRPAA